MTSTRNALIQALTKNLQQPHTITIDNGKEFIGSAFQEILRQYCISDHRTHPYIPQENGKIERWWGTLERTLLQRDKLDDFVNMYYSVWSHEALSEMLGKRTTPDETWATMEHYSPGKGFKITYD
jgi:transposase InsO family protein